MGELGLSLDELAGLSTAEQTQRIVDAAMPLAGSINENEIWTANINVVYWALNEESPTPFDLAERWVVEYAWQVWITETGTKIRDVASDGRSRLHIEQQMRAALEARVSATSLPNDRPLTSTDFRRAIRGALDSLNRITEGVVV